MIAIEPAGMTGPNVVESALRLAMSSAAGRQKLLDATGWDASMPSKICAGTNGITLDKLDAMCRAMGLTIVQVEYMDYLARGNEIGSRCCKARMSMGSCGAR